MTRLSARRDRIVDRITIVAAWMTLSLAIVSAVVIAVSFDTFRSVDIRLPNEPKIGLRAEALRLHATGSFACLDREARR